MPQQTRHPAAAVRVRLLTAQRLVLLRIGQNNLLSITASVHFFSISHARNRSNSLTLVPNRRTSWAGFRSAGPVKTQTAKNFFPTSIPAQFSTLTSSMAPPYRREAAAFIFILSRGLDSTNLRSVRRRPDHFPNG